MSEIAFEFVSEWARKKLSILIDEIQGEFGNGIALGSLQSRYESTLEEAKQLAQSVSLQSCDLARIDRALRDIQQDAIWQQLGQFYNKSQSSGAHAD
jgi:hypothetical protein